MTGPHEGSWPTAIAKGVGIVAYFVVATVWFPSWLLRLSGVASAAAPVQNLIGSGSWLVLLVAGMWGLRRLQAMGVI